MMQMNIVAAEKKAHVVLSNGEEVICPIVKDRENSYSVNIKKLGFARSFISIGQLEDKVLDFDEAALSTARVSAKRGPKTVTIPEDALGYLDDDQIDTLNGLLGIINDGYKADFDAAQAAKVKPAKEPRAKLTEEEKLERQIAKLMAKKAALHNTPVEDGDDEVVED